jgi:hypothetical protein
MMKKDIILSDEIKVYEILRKDNDQDSTDESEDENTNNEEDDLNNNNQPQFFRNRDYSI